MRKKILLIVIVVMLYVYFNLVRIDVEIPLVEVSYGEPDIKANKLIHFSGSKYKRFFKASYFVGTVIVGDTKVESGRFNLNDFDVLIGKVDNSGYAKSFASIYVNSSFDEVTLLVFENGGWSTNDGIVLTGQVNNHDEAVDMINKHMKTNIVLRSDDYQ